MTEDCREGFPRCTQIHEYLCQCRCQATNRIFWPYDLHSVYFPWSAAWAEMSLEAVMSRLVILICWYTKEEKVSLSRSNFFESSIYLVSNSANLFWFSGRLISTCNWAFRVCAVDSESQRYAWTCNGHFVTGLYKSKIHATISSVCTEHVIALWVIKCFDDSWKEKKSKNYDFFFWNSNRTWNHFTISCHYLINNIDSINAKQETNIMVSFELSRLA